MKAIEREREREILTEKKSVRKSKRYSIPSKRGRAREK